ncbi:MAG: TlpA family protein disulfide reductase [Verrucomicrobia bacterium]|nr:TlpA family protein disulfide reductase [Verrucomicrobiota bacterium]
MSYRNPILSLAAAGLLALAPLRAEIKAGDAFPALAEAGLTGGTVPVTAGKVVVVDFWASWCAPCKASFPALAKIQADYAARGVVIVAVSVDEKDANYAAFVKKWAPPFAVVHDQTHRLAAAVDVPAMPSSYVLGRDGRVRFVHQGFHGAATDRELRAQLDQLLAEKN